MPAIAPSLRPRRRRLGHDCAGNMAVEFALCLPVLLLLMLGSAELGRFVLLHQKMDRVATTVADLVARAETISEGELDDIFTAVGEVALPFTIDDLGVVIVTAVSNLDGAGAVIAWQRSGGGSQTVASAYGVEGDEPELPRGLRGPRRRDRDHLRGLFRLHALPLRDGGRAADHLPHRPPPPPPRHPERDRARLISRLDGARARLRTDASALGLVRLRSRE